MWVKSFVSRIFAERSAANSRVCLPLLLFFATIDSFAFQTKEKNFVKHPELAEVQGLRQTPIRAFGRASAAKRTVKCLTYGIKRSHKFPSKNPSKLRQPTVLELDFSELEIWDLGKLGKILGILALATQFPA